MKLLDSSKRIYTKYNCKQKHFLWVLSLSTPCMSHFHSNNQFPRISNLIPCIPTAIPQIPTLIPCISHIPKLIPPISLPIHGILNLIVCIPTQVPPLSSLRSPISQSEFENTCNQLKKQPSKCFAKKTVLQNSFSTKYQTERIFNICKNV